MPYFRFTNFRYVFVKIATVIKASTGMWLTKHIFVFIRDRVSLFDNRDDIPEILCREMEISCQYMFQILLKLNCLLLHFCEGSISHKIYNNLSLEITALIFVVVVVLVASNYTIQVSKYWVPLKFPLQRLRCRQFYRNISQCK